MDIKHSKRSLAYIKLTVAAIYTSAFLYALNTATAVEFMKVFSLSILVSIASSALGGAFGFLFGIPNQKKSDAVFEHNTSLKQISDWLTKIIIGVSLVELKSLALFFKQLVFSIAYLASTENSYIVLIGAIIIIFFIKGFLISYMVTITNYPKELAKIDKELKNLRTSDNVEKPLQMSSTVEKEKYAIPENEKIEAEHVAQNENITDLAVVVKAAKILFRQGSYDASARLFDRAYRIDSQDITSKYNEAFIRSKFLKEHHTAKSILENLIRADATLVVPYYNLACIYTREYKELTAPEGDREVRKEALKNKIVENLQEVFKRDKDYLDQALSDEELKGTEVDIQTVFNECT